MPQIEGPPHRYTNCSGRRGDGLRHDESAVRRSSLSLPPFASRPPIIRPTLILPKICPRRFFSISSFCSMTCSQKEKNARTTPYLGSPWWSLAERGHTFPISTFRRLMPDISPTLSVRTVTVMAFFTKTTQVRSESSMFDEDLCCTVRQLAPCLTHPTVEHGQDSSDDALRVFEAASTFFYSLRSRWCWSFNLARISAVTTMPFSLSVRNSRNAFAYSHAIISLYQREANTVATVCETVR